MVLPNTMAHVMAIKRAEMAIVGLMVDCVMFHNMVMYEMIIRSVNMEILVLAMILAVGISCWFIVERKRFCACLICSSVAKATKFLSLS